MFNKYKKIIVAIIIIIVLFFIYSFFFGGEKDDSLLSSTSNGPISGADVIGSELIQALNEIETLDLDRSIFEDPIYRSLVDRSQPIPPEPVGRDNPFAPISVIVNQGTSINIPTSDSRSGNNNGPVNNSASETGQ